MINKVILIGRLTKDPQISYTASEKAVCDINLAVQRDYKNKDGNYEADFFKVELWGEIAKRTVDYCKKGDVIGVVGKLTTSNYENNEGKKIYKTYVFGERVSFLSSRSIKEEPVNKHDVNPYEQMSEEVEKDLPF